MISICMAYRDRQAALDQSLAAYASLYRGLDVEISICDDGSHRRPQVPADYPIATTVQHIEPRTQPLNPCVPINRAVRGSSGYLIALTNPEIVHRYSVLAEMADTIEDEKDYVIAAVRAETGEWMCRSDLPHRNQRYLPPGAGFHWCVMFTRDLWDDAGGFDEDYRDGQAWDDADWVWRAHRAGARFKWRDDLVVADVPIGGKTQWPDGGLERNRDLFFTKWPQARG